MAAGQNPDSPRRRRLGDRSRAGEAITTGSDHTPDTSTEHDNGHPNARGTLPMARPIPSTNTPASAGVSAADQAIMRARLAAMAAPRDSDSPRLAKLRAVLRDQALMDYVTANVEQWPPLSEEQRDTLTALLGRSVNRSRRRAA